MIPYRKNRSYDNERKNVGRTFLAPKAKNADFLTEDRKKLADTRVADSTLQYTLGRARNAEEGAKEELVGQLRWLSYSVAYSFSRKSARIVGFAKAWRMEEVIGEAHCAIVTAVRRLLKPPHQECDDIQWYVRSVVWSKLRKMSRDEGSDLYVPCSTNSTRAEDEKYRPLLRAYPSLQPENDSRLCEASALDNSQYSWLREDQTGSEYTPPSRFSNSAGAESLAEMNEFLGKLGEGDIQILQRRYAGDSLKTIASSMSLTLGKIKYRLKKIRKAYRDYNSDAEECSTQSDLLDCIFERAINTKPSEEPEITLPVTLNAESEVGTWAAQSV